MVKKIIFVLLFVGCLNAIDDPWDKSPEVHAQMAESSTQQAAAIRKRLKSSARLERDRNLAKIYDEEAKIHRAFARASKIPKQRRVAHNRGISDCFNRLGELHSTGVKLTKDQGERAMHASMARESRNVARGGSSKQRVHRRMSR